MLVARDLAHDLLDPLGLADDGVLPEHQLRRALQVRLAADGGLEAAAVLRQGLADLVALAVGRVGRQARVEHRGPPQVGLDVNRHDGEQAEPIDLVGDDLLKEVVEPGRPRIVAGGPVQTGTLAAHRLPLLLLRSGPLGPRSLSRPAGRSLMTSSPPLPPSTGDPP